MITALVLAFGVLVVYIFARVRNPRPVLPHTPSPLANQDSIEDRLSHDRDIIRMTKPESSLSDRLARRSTANARLRTTFGIDNSLTTFERDQHEAFRETALAIIHEHGAKGSEGQSDRAQQTCWTKLYAHAESFLRQEVGTAHETVRLGLADVVRCLCLRVVLAQVFSGVDPQAPSRQTVLQVTRLINKQWMESKHRAADGEDSTKLGMASPEMSEALKKLVREMASAMAEDEREPLERTNSESCKPCREKRRLAATMAEMTPETILGLLMPPYETLWRVVLLTFVTAYHRQLREDTVSRVDGVPGCLGKRALESKALAVADEGLRLYPSNKRIYRALPPDAKAGPGSERRLTSVNIEGWHRDPAVWGDNALEFQPARFDAGSLTPLQRNAYLPFGLAPHKCPADQRFGTRTITMLVVALGRELGPHVARIWFHNQELDARSEESDDVKDKWAPLPTGRDDMETWEAVVKREPGVVLERSVSDVSGP